MNPTPERPDNDLPPRPKRMTEPTKLILALVVVALVTLAMRYL